jgi:hypothetical protein
MRLSAVSRLTWLPSGSLRAMSNNKCAETVIAPDCSTETASRLSTTCRSRSVAMIRTWPSPEASISTFDRIGIVLRRSTTDWTWDKQRSSFARSMVAFIATQTPLRALR